MQKNLMRMLELVNSFFDMKNDPDQLQVNDAVQDQLHQLHPACLTEVTNEDGPILWLLLFPCHSKNVEAFLKDELNEQELFDKSVAGNTDFDTVYLCSVSVLHEFRKNGLAITKTIEAINAMRVSFAITQLCVWPFSADGERLSQAIAEKVNLPLLVKPYEH